MKQFFLVLFCLASFFKATAQFPGWSNATAYGGAAMDIPEKATMDGSGNVYIAGYFTSPTLNFGTTTLTNGSGNEDAFIAKITPAGTVSWALSISGSGIDLIQAITADASGNVYIAGIFNSPSITLGTTTLSNSKIFVAKISTLGSVVWATSPASTVAFVGDITVDPSGNIYVTGGFGNNFGNGNPITFGTTTLTTMGYNDIYIAKYNSSGTPQWAISTGGASNEYGKAIEVNANGDLFVSGEIINVTSATSSVPFGSTTISTAPSIRKVFLTKYSSTGFSWAVSALTGAAPNNQANYGGMALDPNGDILLAGSFTGSANSGSTTLTSAGLTDAYVTKFNSTGASQWIVSYGGLAGDEIWGLGTDPTGNVLFTGLFSSASLTIGTNVLSNTGSDDGFLAKLSGSGTALWATGFGGTGSDGGLAAVTDGSNTYISGVFNSTSISLGTNTLNNVSADYDMFLAKIGTCTTPAPPQPSAISGPASVCVGSSQTYSVPAVTGATSYNWTLPSGWTGTSNTNSITVTAGTTGGNITVAAANACSTSVVQTLTVTIAPGPTATITAAGATTFCQGGSVVLNAPTGTGYTYQWKLNGNNITGATNASYTANAAGSYTVVVSSSSCSTASSATTVTVNPLPTPTITQTGFTLSTAAGQGTYQWYKNAAVISGATTNSYTVTQNGSYYVSVTNSSNCTGQSNTINITNVSVKGPKKREFNIYPTTNNGRFIIQLPEESSPSALRIVNMQGQTVKNEVLQQYSNQLHVNILDNVSGLYLVELVYPDEVYYEKVIIK